MPLTFFTPENANPGDNIKSHESFAVYSGFDSSIAGENPSIVYLDDGKEMRSKLSAIFMILFVSLFAVSFPALSKRLTFVRVPRLVFFIGKHFGTGVILSTAFAHLLQDAFEALHDPIVRARWPIANSAGIIILTSLLSIFLVEYISTSYVDRLQSYSSAPPSPASSPGPSDPPSRAVSIIETPQPDLEAHPSTTGEERDEVAPLLTHRSSATFASTASHPSPSIPVSMTASYGTVRSAIHPSSVSGSRMLYASPDPEALVLSGHHRFETRASHESHRSLGPRRSIVLVEPQDRDTSGAVRISRRNTVIGHEREQQGNRDSSRSEHHDPGYGHGHGHGFEFSEGEDDIRVGKKRQVVGILVLQLGIMLHSSVIGLTLAITSGAQFTSLITAIIFHQLFEGLSLGIRIAALPSSTDGKEEGHSRSESAMSVDPVHLEHPTLPSSSSTSSFLKSSGELGPSTSRAHNRSASHNHDPPKHVPQRRWFWLGMGALKTILAVSFAVTTPVGIAVGIAVFGHAARASGEAALRLKFTQGFMSAISAGMLIYASCVEMLAADFVMDAKLWRSGLSMQALALGSLAAGVLGMSMVG